MSQFGLSEDELNTLAQLVVGPLVGAGAKVWCFGSRARGDHKKFSDIDLMVESERDLTVLVGKVREAIIESNFPYKVDLVELKYFAKQYRNSFDSEKVLIPFQGH